MKAEFLKSIRQIRHGTALPLRPAVLSVCVLLFAGSAFLAIPGGTGSSVQAQEKKTPEPLQNAERLNADECDRLYTHQLKVVQSDPENPLYSSVQLNSEVLRNPATRKAEVEHCQANVSRPGFQCQMQAQSLAALLECRRKFDGSEASEDGGDANTQTDPGKQPQPEDQGESYFEDTSTDAAPGGDGRPETMPSGRFAVNAGNCERAYNHIYGVISKTKNFQQRPDRARLIQYWQSNEARGSFAARCMAKFKPEDLGCLLSTRDADILQGCLLVIPAS
ncbi:MAG: hypothetical protein NXI24_07440 [bacterium]|nr:hypothetical protein [bacterium]